MDRQSSLRSLAQSLDTFIGQPAQDGYRYLFPVEGVLKWTNLDLLSDRRALGGGRPTFNSPQEPWDPVRGSLHRHELDRMANVGFFFERRNTGPYVPKRLTSQHICSIEGIRST